EERIRDCHVTGVQTCALPISKVRSMVAMASAQTSSSITVTVFSTLLSRQAVVTQLLPQTKSPLQRFQSMPVKASRQLASQPTVKIGRASCRERKYRETVDRHK